VDPWNSERGGQKEGSKAGKHWRINGLDWTETEYGIGLWTMKVAMDGMCFLGWHKANHWRPDCFFLSFFFPVPLAIYNCLTSLPVFSFFFFSPLAMISIFQSSPEIDMFQGGDGKED